MNKKDIAYHFKHAGCRIPGFGNGCNACPIRKKLGQCCSYDNYDETINVGKLLYRTNSEYRASINIEVKENPDFRSHVYSCKIV